MSSNYNESVAERSCGFCFLSDWIIGSVDIDRVQFRKLLLSTASGLFLSVFFRRSNLFIVVVRTSGSLTLLK